MEYSIQDPTSPSLLRRIRFCPTDQAAWNEFVQRYGQHIHQWCVYWKLQEADAHDVTQTVLIKLVDRLRTFDYDPSKSFRGYVKTLTHFTLCDFLTAQKKQLASGSGDTSVLELLQSLEARDDLEERLTRAFQDALFDRAAWNIRLRVQPKTWAAFELTALEGRSAAEAAPRVGMNVAAVFKAKSNVCKLLRDEIQRLQAQDPDLDERE